MRSNTFEYFNNISSILISLIQILFLILFIAGMLGSFIKWEPLLAIREMMHELLLGLLNLLLG